MALKGTLKDFGIADILQLIGQQGKTGTLHLKSKDQEVHISFKDGEICRAESSTRNKKDLIGAMLVRAELITEAAHAFAGCEPATLERDVRDRLDALDHDAALDQTRADPGEDRGGLAGVDHERHAEHAAGDLGPYDRHASTLSSFSVAGSSLGSGTICPGDVTTRTRLRSLSSSSSNMI